MYKFNPNKTVYIAKQESYQSGRWQEIRKIAGIHDMPVFESPVVLIPKHQMSTCPLSENRAFHNYLIHDNEVLSFDDCTKEILAEFGRISRLSLAPYWLIYAEATEIISYHRFKDTAKDERKDMIYELEMQTLQDHKDMQETYKDLGLWR